jgi:hypothetical protein
MLACFKISQPLAKNVVNPKSRGNQKNRCSPDKLALTNLKRSGFVFINDDLILKILNTNPAGLNQTK